MAITRRRTTVVEEYDNHGGTSGPTQSPGVSRNAQTLQETPAGTGDLDLSGEAVIGQVDSVNASLSKESPARPNVLWHFVATNPGKVLSTTVSIVSLLIVGTWYVSKFESALSSLLSDMRDTKTRVDKLADDLSRYGAKVESLEKNQDRPHQNPPSLDKGNEQKK